MLLPPPEPLPAEPLLDEPLPAAPEPAPDPDPGPEPLPDEPLVPLLPPLWPCVLLVTAAPVLLLFFFALWVEEGLLSAVPAAEASFVVAEVSLAAVCIADVLPFDEPLMLDVPLLDDLLDLSFVLDLSELELVELSLGMELLLDALGLLLLDDPLLGLLLLLESRLLPLPVLELLPLEP